MNADLLKDALAERRAKLKGVSKRTGVPTNRLLALANGEEPTLKEWRLLSKALKLVPSLQRPQVPAQRYEFLFRTSVGGKRPNQDLVAQLSNKLQLSDELGDGPTKQPLSHLRSFFRSANTYLDAEANAQTFRELFVSGDQTRPLLDLPEIVAEQLGIRIFLVDTPGVEGASVVTAGNAFVFLTRRFQPRMLFTLAHELAHVLFHQTQEPEYLSIDFATEYGLEKPKRSRSQEEGYAHAFASALLLPDVGVGLFLKAVRQHSGSQGALGDLEINLLARFFGVSFLAAAARCEALKLLPRGGAISLDEWVKKQFGSAEKRAVEVGLPERELIEFPYFPADMLRTAVERVREGRMSIGRAAIDLGISVEDLISANEQMIH